MTNLIFLTGLPGAGKTTLAMAVEAKRPLKYLSAGSLIATALQSMERDELKNGDVLDNQRLLVEGFYKAAAGFEGNILLDGHVVVRGDEDTVVVPVEVFRQLGCNEFVVLTNDPKQIANNRAKDNARKRLPQTIEELRDDQAVIVGRVNELGRLLSCPVTQISLRDFEQAVERLEAVLAR